MKLVLCSDTASVRQLRSGGLNVDPERLAVCEATDVIHHGQNND